MNKFWRFLSISLVVLAETAGAAPVPRETEIPVKVLESLNVPRGGHSLVVAGDEILVLGGHTTGFVPLSSAERFDGHSWTLIPMHYPHDLGFSTNLPDGSILVGGGTAEAFGIGQSWGVERYVPQTRSFEPVGILDRKRATPRAVCLPDGRVVVGGNWYAPDALEVYIPGKGFQPGCPVTAERSQPWLLSKADGTVYAVSSVDNYGKPLESITADCLDGSSFEIPLLKEWSLMIPQGFFGAEQYSISEHSWLIPATRKEDGLAGIIQVNGDRFSLLNLPEAIPLHGSDNSPIFWTGILLVRRSTRHAYWLGVGEKKFYVLDIDYDATLDGGQPKMELRHTEEVQHILSEPTCALLGDGNILMAGGVLKDNFNPFADVWLLQLSSPAETAASHRSWWWLLLLLIPLIAGSRFLLKRRSPAVPEETTVPEDNMDLMSRIIGLMEKGQLYRKQDLRIADIASLLGTNSTYISATLNGQSGESFFQFITGYRIRYAQKLLSEHPEKRLSEVAEESGFYSERSFFRCFKSLTGMTPTEWKRTRQE